MNLNLGFKELNTKNILDIERKAIQKWTSSQDYYKDIKKVAENKYRNKKHEISSDSEDWFRGLESLFERYQDNTSEFKEIYRVDIIDNTFGIELLDNELFNKFCEDKKIGDIFSFPDLICSFSADKECAKTASQNSKKYRDLNTPQVIYIVENRLSKYLYIDKFSSIIGEKEVLSITNGEFLIKDIKILENNNIEIYLDEVNI